MSANLDEFPAPVTVSPGNTPARAPPSLFRRFVLTVGIFLGAALLASTLLEHWLSYQTLPPLYSSLLRTAVLVLLGVSLAVSAGLVLGGRVVGAISAMEHRLDERTTELGEALQQQTATAEVLKVISRSAFDLQSVLDTLTESAAQLCQADMAGITRPVGEDYYYATNHNFSPDWLAYVKEIPLRRDRGSIVGRVLLARDVVQVADVLADPDYTYSDPARKAGYRTFLGVPLLREGEVIGVLVLARKSITPFTDQQIGLLVTFADQAVIAIENVRLFEEVRTRNHELGETLERQAATSEILRAISGSPTDVQPVFETIAHSAARLCSAEYCFVFRFDGELIHSVAYHGLTQEGIEAVQSRFPAAPDRGSITGRAVLSGCIEQIPDLFADPDYKLGEIARIVHYRSSVAIPMMQDRRPIGVITVTRLQPGAFPVRDVELLQTFSEQAVIAVENVRLFTELEARNRDLNEALEQQTAMAEILRVISSSPTDIQPVFDTIAESAARLCKARFCFVFRFDGELLHFVSSHGVAPAGIDAVRSQWPAAPGRQSTASRAVLSGTVEEIPDVHLDPDYEFGNVADIAHYRSIVAVPMIRDGSAIGAIAVARSQTGLFPERQVELLKAFAAQAVIAVENVRLFTELDVRNRDLNEALEQQTATAEILSEISRSPTDIQPVFEMIAQSSARLCEAQFCFVADYDGTLVHFVAQYGMPAETVEALRRAYPRPPSRASTSARTILSGRVEQIPDVDADPEYELLEIDKRTYRSMVGVPILKDGRPIGAFVVGRSQAGLFAERQVKLLETFADQAVIAIENVRLFTEVQTRNRELNEALEQHTATGDILRVISSSPTNIQPVFETIADSAARLCGARFCFVYSFDGSLLHLMAHHGLSPETADAMLARFPMVPGREIAGARAILSGTVEHIPDVRADADYSQPLSEVINSRSIVAVPMLRNGSAIGAIALDRTELGYFPERQIKLLETFADQAVIAIGNVGLFTELEVRNRELHEALQQQTATADVLKVISRSTFDLQAVLNTLIESSIRLCEADDATILLRESDALRVEAHQGPIPVDFAKWPISRQWVSGRAVVDAAPIHVHDLAAADEYPDGQAMALRMGHRTTLAVPLLRGQDAIGALMIRRREVKPFAEKQINLLMTFADQAVIAIENVRLFDQVHARTRELTAALEQQTATSEILRAISMSPSSVQPVFETIVRNALPLCGSLFANVFRFDGELLHYVASHNIGPDFLELLHEKYPMRPDSSQVAGRVILNRSVVRLENALDDRDYDQTFPLAMGWRRLLGVPMLREGEPLGVIVVGWAEAGPVSPRQENLLKTFADQAVIAVENVRLFDEVQSRTRELAQSVEELRALGEVSQAVNSTLDLETVLNTIVAKAVQLSGTDAGSIYVLNKANTRFKLRATYGMAEATVAAIRHSSIRAGETAIGQATEQRQPLQIADVLDAPAAGVLDVVVQAGYRSFLIVPLLGPDRAIGVLVIRRKLPGVFPDSTTDLLQTFAAQSVLAIQNARLFHEIEEKSQQLELASRHKSQFLANMSHELRTPLNAILGYSELILDDIYGAVPEKARAALERVQSNGKHLLGLINDVLDLAKIEAGRLTLSLADYAMDEVVASVVAAVEALAAEKHLALTADVPCDLPIGHGDEQRIRQVLLNLVSNAIKFTDAGEVTIRARVGDGVFQVAVSDTGPGISAEDQAKLFQEFQQADSSSTRTKGGTGLGLAISRRFIDLHGGRIRVESELGHGSTFSFELPVTVELPEDVG